MENMYKELCKIAYEPEYVKQEPYVNDIGIYVPVKEYAPKGTMSAYRLLISQEMFVEAYNKWIKGVDGDEGK